MTHDAPLTLALAQIAPVWLDREATVAKAADWVRRASAEGARLVAFGEALAPGYPFWIEHTEGARFESPLQKQLFAHYAAQAVDLPRDDLAPVRAAAREGRIWVALGIIERARDRGHSLYCSLVLIDDAGEVRNVHRKLMPTHEERLAWSPGDGHGLRCFPVDGFTLGALNCWENWMPLARAALYAQGEDLHIATWPGSVRNTRDITRHMAREGRSYVASVSSLMRRADIPEHLPHAELLRAALPEICANGGSCVAGPDGEWIIEPCTDEERLLICELDPAHVRAERHNFDPFGHYSRPDVLELHVNRARQCGARFVDGDD
ncbi:carbon-nitrogen hydrolase family protein [Cognatilysobacter bugurensis]|uniref:Nitrilase n=1 Tax=Cognatilysobacter bugurensis TaxID=543356 RepID=A0A918T0L2_9GAMM|nr:carbon-nitrogen hydrolase family protein [Lysobacter bugurensis]GHA78973.1 nitrilase [Lysobacter bugurensis]